ncbi:hypothetical protein PR048_010662 [Dryococelus australis]|uniref:Uncharacterized protein n=1 Tax=Dryococelus australis TaxID=614101 RepID=A0ABQ9I3D2_9NEOP|nr:hypothetical protein PR048_010662 [Dryococelus australis]
MPLGELPTFAPSFSRPFLDTSYLTRLHPFFAWGCPGGEYSPRTANPLSPRTCSPCPGWASCHVRGSQALCSTPGGPGLTESWASLPLPRLVEARPGVRLPSAAAQLCPSPNGPLSFEFLLFWVLCLLLPTITPPPLLPRLFAKTGVSCVNRGLVGVWGGVTPRKPTAKRNSGKVVLVILQFKDALSFGTLLQGKWKGLRDCFSRELRKKLMNIKSGSGASNTISYIHFTCLGFLENSMHNKETTSKLEDTYPENGQAAGDEENADLVRPQTQNQNRCSSRKKI